MIQGIDHLNIVVRDIKKAKQFFLELGFTADPKKAGALVGDWIEKVTGLKQARGYYCTLSLPGAQTNIELIQYQSPGDMDDPLISKPNHVGFRHVALVVDDIDKVIQQLKKKKITFFSEIQKYQPTKKKLCYFLGPDGIILELVAYEK